MKGLRKEFPIPKKQGLLLKLEGFKYAISLELKLGYVIGRCKS